MVFYDALKHPVDHIVSREGMTLQPSDFPIYEFLGPGPHFLNSISNSFVENLTMCVPVCSVLF